MNDQEKTTRIHRGHPLWVKGICPNPLGRPKKIKCIPDILARIGKMIAPEDIQEKMRKRYRSKEKLTMQQAVLMMTYDLAAHGTEWAVEFIAERTEGKAIQSMNITTPAGPLIQIIRPPLDMKPIIDITETPKKLPASPPDPREIPQDPTTPPPQEGE